MDGSDLTQRIQLLLDDAQRVAGLSVTVHDRTGTLAGYLPGRWYSHRHPFCLAGRDTCPGFEGRCQEHCWQAMNRRAAAAGEPFVHSCWKGGAEACAPVLRDGVHQLTIFGGILAAEPRPPAGLEPVAARAWRTLAASDPVRLLAAARVLAAVGQGLLALLDERRRLDAGSRRAAVERFIEVGLHRPLALAELGRHLGLSVSRAAHVVRDQFGVSFGTLLLDRRLALACHLLAAGDASVGEVARRCGFASQQWFSRVFTRRHGEPPGRWRRTHRPQA